MSVTMHQDPNRKPDPNVLTPKDKKSSEKDYPRYDDIMHIDSTACKSKPDAPRGREPRVDPVATEYTELYCENTQN